MKRHRIFIAINFPEDVKRRLGKYQEKWPELPAKWTKPNNLHITLVFLGYVANEELLGVSESVKEMALKHNFFDVNLNKICYGPLKKMPPRMIWVQGEKSQEFAFLRDGLEKSLLLSNKVDFSPENRAFSPHITLARIKQWEWCKIEPEERPKIEEDINISFPVNSIEIMESELKRGGAEYSILESHNLAT